MKVIQNIIIIFILFIILGAFIRGCGKPANQTSGLSDLTEIDSSSVVSDVEDPGKSWQYSEDEDKMTSKTTYFAQVKAKELLLFGSPYDGGSIATLVLRNKGRVNNVYFSVSKGQMLTRTYESTSYRIRFDDKPMKRYSFTAPSDGSSNLAFIDEANAFIAKAKKSKKVIIEIEFYQEGLRAIEFDVSNLNWPH